MVLAELGIPRQANGFHRSANGVRHERAWIAPTANARKPQQSRRVILAQADPENHSKVSSTSVKSESTHARQVRARSEASIPVSNVYSTAYRLSAFYTDFRLPPTKPLWGLLSKQMTPASAMQQLHFLLPW